MSISRVIEVSFGGGSIAYAKVDTAYFYNNGILFKPTDIDLPASYQVHWADSPQASSTLETIGTAEGAPIPDDLWDRSRVIYGWIYLHPTEDSGVTGYEVRIYKNVRAGLPDGTEPTPAEQSTIDQLIGALNSAVEQTGEDMESAEQAKDDAESARDNAQTYANNAQSSAQASARSAESASESARVATEKATASAQSASQSAQIKSDIEGMVDDAQSYAESALIASQASVTARDTAQGYAQSASASAQSASTSASNASTSAQTASTKATEASTSAQTASQKATEASQSASQASGYAQTAESAKTDAQTAQGKAEDAQTAAETAQGKAEDAQAAAESVAESIPSDYSQLSEDFSDLKEELTPILDFKKTLNWIRGTWSNGVLNTGSSAYKRRTQPAPFMATDDLMITLSDYNEFRMYVDYFSTDGTFIKESNWSRSPILINKGEHVTLIIGYVDEASHEVETEVKNDLYDALTIETLSNIPFVLNTLGSLTENTVNLLQQTNADSYVNSYPLLLDLGEDVTFQNGVIFSFDAKNLVVSNITAAVVDLRESDGTHHYVTGNSLYDANGKHFINTEPQNGRFYTKGFAPYESSITFRYVYLRNSPALITSGKMMNFMLNAGTDILPFSDSKTAIDYEARNKADKLIADQSIPDYWVSALDSAKQTILENRLAIASGDEFIFVTDQHWTSNAQKSSKLIDSLMDDLLINFIVCGGDIVASHNATKMGAVKEIVDYYKSFKHRHRILSTIGNHDLNSNNNPDTSLHLSPQELYSVMIKPEETWIDTSNSAYCNAYDNESQKIRYIQFYYNYDSGFIQSVADALVSKMTSAPADWTIVLISHAYWNGANPASAATQYANLILQTMDAIDATVALWLVGHNHKDGNTTLTSNGNKSLLIVSTTTDAAGQNPSSPPMTRGTNTEQAFDVVQIDTTVKKIYMTRIGAGSNREFSY